MKLIGVGVGPGDPELVTVKAVRVLRTADVVFVPVADTGEPGRAEQTVRAHVDRPLQRLVFALGDPAGREAAWQAAAAVIARAEGTVAFATIGDPNLYSTFSYLATVVRRFRSTVEIETVPGITAMQDLAARSHTVLAEGTESLALLPLADGLARLPAALARFDTVVAYKGGRAMPAVLDMLREAGRLDDAVYGASLGLPDEQIAPAAELAGVPAPYLSTLIVRSR